MTPTGAEPYPDPYEDPHGWGAALQRARTRAGQSLEAVSARTCIRTVVLRDLEAGVTASSGGDVYARGHVRSIAQALGLDPAPLLAEFDAQRVRAEPVATAPAQRSRVARSGPAGRSTAPAGPAPRAVSLRVPAAPAPTSLRVPPPARVERRGPHWGAALAAALSVLVVLLAVGTFTGGDQVRDAVPAGDVFAGPSADPSPRATAPPLQAAVPAPTGARLRVRVLSGKSWMRVQGADGTLFEGVFSAGEPPKDFTDPKELRLLVGNAAALSVVCGAKDLAPAGDEGAVRRFTCGTEGLVPA